MNDHDERNQTGILTSGFNLAPAFPPRSSWMSDAVAIGSLWPVTVAQPFRILTGFPEHLAAIKMNSRSPFSKSTAHLEEISATAKNFLRRQDRWACFKRAFGEGRKNEVCQSASEYFLPQATATLRPRKQNHRQEPHRPALNRGCCLLAGGEATAEATRDDRSHPRHQSPGFEPLDHLQRRLMTECVTSWGQPHAKPLKVKGERGRAGGPRYLPGKQKTLNDFPIIVPQVQGRLQTPQSLLSCSRRSTWRTRCSGALFGFLFSAHIESKNEHSYRPRDLVLHIGRCGVTDPLGDF